MLKESVGGEFRQHKGNGISLLRHVAAAAGNDTAAEGLIHLEMSSLLSLVFHAS